MRNTLFPSHLEFVIPFWKSAINENSTVVDATCGNGKDSRRLVELLKEKRGSHFVGIDIQKEAITKTQSLLFSSDELSNPKVTLIHASHETFPLFLKEETVSLIVYNLGYLPGADKSLTTLSSSTLNSLKNALDLLSSKGLISITCYPGHEEGEEEEKLLSSFVSSLSLLEYDVVWYKRLNKPLAPSVILIQKTV